MEYFENLGFLIKCNSMVGGNPYKANPKDPRRICFSWLILFKLAINFVLAWSFIPILLVIGYVDLGLDRISFQLITDTLGINVMDFAAVIICQGVANVVIVINLVIHWMNVNQLNEVVTELRRVETLYDIPLKLLVSKSMVKTFFVAVVIIAVAMIMQCFCNATLYDQIMTALDKTDQRSQVLKWIFIASAVPTVSCGFMSAPIAGAIAIMILMIKLPTEGLKHVKAKLKAREATDDNPLATIRHSVSALIQLMKLKRKMTTLISPLLIGNFGSSVLVGILMLYSCSAILFSKWQLFHFFNSLFALMVGVAYLYNMKMTCHVGQVLESEVEATRICLKRQAVRFKPLMPTDLATSWEYLDDLMITEGKLTPYGFFSVNNSAFLVCLSTIGTYLVVLMQFRAS